MVCYNYHIEKRNITFASDSYVLSGKYVLPKLRKNRGVLIIHGGGRSNKERYIELQDFLACNGYMSFSYDTRGVGESTGIFCEGTLRNRLVDAQAAYDKLNETFDKIAVIGCSMGGHVAALLTEKRIVHKLILLYSAAYAIEAEDIELNKKFTDILHRQDSWRTSRTFEIVRNFGENVLMLYGEHEQVIPKEVQLKYRNAVGNRGKFVVLKNGTHGLLAPRNKNQEEAKNRTLEELLNFL